MNVCDQIVADVQELKVSEHQAVPYVNGRQTIQTQVEGLHMRKSQQKSQIDFLDHISWKVQSQVVLVSFGQILWTVNESKASRAEIQIGSFSTVGIIRHFSHERLQVADIFGALFVLVAIEVGSESGVRLMKCDQKQKPAKLEQKSWTVQKRNLG